MYWKMWIGCDPDTLIVVEADTLDEAFREAREVDRGYSTAQPMTDEEAREASTGYDDAVAVIRYLGDLDRAEEAADKARSTRCWDCVYVTEWTLV